MKKIIGILYIFTIFAVNCTVGESLGVVDNAYKGSEAREKIRNTAFNADGIYYEKKYGGYSGLVTNISVTNSLIVAFSLDLDDLKYYDKTKVDHCISDMEKFSYLNFFDSLTTVKLSENCRNFEEITFFSN
ncbi:TIGR04452 family lipoprotein [Leptospira venezuelensis]|uniref:TIGR04452 family lipoprotein n=1 Tax=Leptospira venezuelensis TaxID=1958811 RepID=UPI0012FF78FD|nr:TIGR04452 family lipoprotein [Leptospira venezuelensis]